MANRYLISRSEELQRSSARAGLAFLCTDLDTALIFATRALQAHDGPETRLRNQANARKGYDAIFQIFKGLSSKLANRDQTTEIEEKLSELRAKLVELGETRRAWIA